MTVKLTVATGGSGPGPDVRERQLLGEPLRTAASRNLIRRRKHLQSIQRGSASGRAALLTAVARLLFDMWARRRYASTCLLRLRPMRESCADVRDVVPEYGGLLQPEGLRRHLLRARDANPGSLIFIKSRRPPTVTVHEDSNARHDGSAVGGIDPIAPDRLLRLLTVRQGRGIQGIGSK